MLAKSILCARYLAQVSLGVRYTEAVRQESDLRAVETLERRLLMPSVRRSSEELNSLLADEFVEIGSSGRIWSKDEIVEELLNSPSCEVEIDSVHARHIAENAVLITYRSWRVGEEHRAVALRSSIWRRRGRSWRLMFHQGTKARM